MHRVGMMTGVDSWPVGTAHGRHIMAVTYAQHHVRPIPMCGVAGHAPRLVMHGKLVPLRVIHSGALIKDLLLS